MMLNSSFHLRLNAIDGSKIVCSESNSTALLQTKLCTRIMTLMDSLIVCVHSTYCRTSPILTPTAPIACLLLGPKLCICWVSNYRFQTASKSADWQTDKKFKSRWELTRFAHMKALPVRVAINTKLAQTIFSWRDLNSFELNFKFYSFFLSFFIIFNYDY